MPKPEPPPLRQRKGLIVIQNILDVPVYTDPDLPPGTIEVWRDGECIVQVNNIGSR